MSLLLARIAQAHRAGATSYFDEVMADNPISYWRLAETSGTVASALGTAAIAGTYQGGYTLGQASLCGDPTDFACLLNGSTGRITAGTATDLRKASDFTIEAVIRPAAIGATQAIAGHGYLGPLLRITPAGKLNFLKSYSVDRGTGTTALSAGVRYVVAATVSAAGVSSFYVNGTFDGNGSNGIDYGAPTQPWRIGCDTSSGGATDSFFNGVIDEVVLYPAALSAARLLSHAHAAGLA